MADEVFKPGGSSEKQGFSPTPKQIAAAVLGVLLLVVVFQNTQDTTVTLLFFDVNASLWIILLGTIAISLLIGVLIGGHRAKPSKKAKKGK